MNRRVALGAGGAAIVVVALFATCGACRKSAPGGGAASASATTSASASAAAAAESPRAPIDDALWTAAKDGEEEDLATLAAHEGAAGLVEKATKDPSARLTAIRAMAYARGWAQLPYLMTAASGDDANDAKAALDAIEDLAARRRRSEDNEDVPELTTGCDALLAFARDTKRDRARRISAIRSLRMMPCPKADLPTDVDTR